MRLGRGGDPAGVRPTKMIMATMAARRNAPRQAARGFMKNWVSAIGVS